MCCVHCIDLSSPCKCISIIFYAVANGIIFSVSLFDSSLLVYKMLILYPAASLNWLINSNSFDGVPHPVNIELSKNS